MIEVSVRPGPGALQRAIDALPRNGAPAVIRLTAGVYREKVVLDRPSTALVGEGAGGTLVTWGDGAGEILADGVKRGTFRTATLRTDGAGITLRGLTVENSAGPGAAAGQAIALYADGDGFLCEDCVLLGHQDTLFTAPLPPREIEPGGFNGPKRDAPRVPQRQVYRRCRIRGDVDFIFGGAAAWFEDCEIVSDAPGWCTAASTPEGQPMGYVFTRCRFTAEEGVAAGSVYLGRPWREWAKTVLLGCELGPHIHPAHWDDWGKPAFYGRGDYAEDTPAEGLAPFARVLTPAEAAGYTEQNFMETALGE